MSHDILTYMSRAGVPMTLNNKLKLREVNTKNQSELYISLLEYIDSLTPDIFPTITDASIYAGINEKTLLSFEARSIEGSDIRGILNIIRDRSKSYLMHNGLNNKINGKLTAMLLGANHDMQSKPTELTQNNTFNISPELLAEAILLSKSPHK